MAVCLKELEPSLSITIFETLEARPGELAGVEQRGHRPCGQLRAELHAAARDGSVDISEALKVNTEFDLSRQLWSYLIRRRARSRTRAAFIHPCPHMSFVWGKDNVAFLRKRYAAMSAHHCYYGMEYTEDNEQIAEWAPLIMEGRARTEPIAATRIITGRMSTTVR